MSAFSVYLEMMFSWLPSELYIPVIGILGAAFLILMIKILTALVTVISKIVMFFIP